jgi:hypothetical protein
MYVWPLVMAPPLGTPSPGGHIPRFRGATVDMSTVAAAAAAVLHPPTPPHATGGGAHRRETLLEIKSRYHAPPAISLSEFGVIALDP